MSLIVYAAVDLLFREDLRIIMATRTPRCPVEGECGRIMDYQPSPDLERDHSCLEVDVKVASESVPRARIPGLLSSSFCRLKI